MTKPVGESRSDRILGTSDPMAVQEHMLKLFDNTAALTFDRGGTKVQGMVSSEKESFAFETICATACCAVARTRD